MLPGGERLDDTFSSLDTDSVTGERTDRQSIAVPYAAVNIMDFIKYSHIHDVVTSWFAVQCINLVFHAIRFAMTIFKRT